MRTIFAFCFLLGLGFTPLKASHYTAGFVTYRYIGDSTNTPGEYLVEGFIYRPNVDRSWGNTPITVQISGCTLDTSLNLNKVLPPAHRQHPIDINLWTVANDLSCSDSASSNAMGIYRATIVLAPCTNYTFTLSTSCCREIVDNYTWGSSSNNLQVTATLNNSKRENSLPKPIHARYFPDLCVNQTFLIGGFQPDENQDPNYVLPDVYQTVNGPMSLDSGFTRYQPLPTNPPSPGGYYVDSTSGVTRISPLARGRYGLVFKYTERPFDTASGLYYTIGSYVVDIIADVSNFCSPQDTVGLELSFKNQQKQQSDSCGLTSSILKTSQAMQPGTIDPGATDFSVFSFRRRAPEPVRSAEMLDAHTVKINYFFPLSANDTIRIISKIGADGNRVVNACGFDQAQADTLYQVVNGCGLGIEEQEALRVSVYPNPSKGILHIKNDGNQIVKRLLIYSIEGVKLMHLEKPASEINIAHLASGSYILGLTFENGETTQKKITLL